MAGSFSRSGDLGLVKWGSGVSLHGSNLEPPMSALGQKRTLERVRMECAPIGGHLAGLELTRTAGLSEDESHGQAPFP